MRVVPVVAVDLLIAIYAATAAAQSPCHVQGPPYGPTPYDGNAQYEFEYWSHKGTVNGENFYPR